MMKDIFDEIATLKNSYLLTPYNLLENAKLSHYEYVKYYTEKEFLICEMKFEVLKKDYIFYYYFDKNDKLQKIYKKEEKEVSLFFSRKKEIEKKIEELKLSEFLQKSIS
ncbi:hypothetical protein LIY46_04130 [Fusobacterium varium]|jgi:hypothetical protein|uniref:hypothetical protein n=1 Tax=Fusobacterium TaxID=848 RepID=UPI00189C336A|nr:hypothetical protein [Fusobacterium varium]MCI6034245.1 hypothetical protein [Fusobacterium varium]DAK06655.1 MAG TPA: hypothetical protein [Caudoviricetes sp.]